MAPPRGKAAIDAGRAHLEGGGDNSGGPVDSGENRGENEGTEPGTDAGDATSGDGGRAEAEHLTAIERMEQAATDFQLTSEALVFDVRDFLLEQIKVRPKPWSATSSGEQRDVAAACEHAAQELVRKVVEAIRADGRDPIRALLESYSEKDGLKASLKVKTFSEEESLAAVVGLHRAVGKHVLIIVASADDYKGGEREPEILPDEPGLQFEAGTDHPEDDADLAGEHEAEGDGIEKQGVEAEAGGGEATLTA